MPGPVPKRSDQRRRRNKPVIPVSKVEGAAVQIPELGFDAHPVVVDWYAALADGPESRFYTPALWQRARVCALMLSKVLESGRPSSQMYVALQADLKSLLVDAAELRRLGIEVQPAAEPAGDRSNVIDWRARASAGA